MYEITSDLIASSLARPPALRITCALPSLRPAYLAGSSRASMQVRIAKRRAGGRQARPWRRTTLSLRRGTWLNVPPARIHFRAGIGPLGDGVRRLSFGDQHAPECLNRKHSHRLSRCARSTTDVRREDDLIE